MRWFLALITFGVCAAWGAAAVGQDAPERETVDEAERLYLSGVDAFQAGEPARAAELFRRSWELVPKPELLYNEALAWAASGDVERARRVATNAAAADLPPKMRDKNLARLHAWTLRQRSVAIAEGVASQPAVTEGTEAEPSEPVTFEAASSTPAEPEAEVGAVPEPPGRTARVLGIALGSGGVATLGAAGFVSWRIGQIGAELDTASQRGDRAEYDALVRRGARLQTAGIVLLGAGAALTTTGLVLWLAAPSGERQTVALTAGPTSIDFAVWF